MSKYNIYKHEVLGLKAVPKGVSIAGFLLSFFWMAYKKLWNEFLIWVVATGVFTFLNDFLQSKVRESLTDWGDSFFPPLTMMIIAASLIIYLFAPLIYLNDWTESKLKAQGYKHDDTVAADNQSDAIKIYNHNLENDNCKPKKNDYYPIASELFFGFGIVVLILIGLRIW